MKKLMPLSTLLLTSFAHISHALDCYNTKIFIKNNTPVSCYLIDQTLKNERHAPDSKIVYKIPAGQISSMAFQAYYSLSNAYSKKYITLTYECGEGQFVTLQSTGYFCYNNKAGDTVSGEILASVNLVASYESTPIDTSIWNNYNKEEGVIHWTIN